MRRGGRFFFLYLFLQKLLGFLTQGFAASLCAAVVYYFLSSVSRAPQVTALLSISASGSVSPGKNMLSILASEERGTRQNSAGATTAPFPK